MQDLGLEGRAVLITGAAGGIGCATARSFAALGARVMLADLDAEALAAVAADTGAAGHLAFDLADPTACEGAVAQAAGRLGGLDALVHAGAMMRRQPLATVAPADLDRQVTVNMTGSFFLARAAAEAMRPQGRGRIVLFSSQGAHTGGYAGSAVYAMTKAAVLALTRSLAREYGPHGITVNAIAPGLVETPMLRDGVDPATLDRLTGMVPLGRVGTPEEIANCCLFLASDWSSYLTGQTLDANGGQLMR